MRFHQAEISETIHYPDLNNNTTPQPDIPAIRPHPQPTQIAEPQMNIGKFINFGDVVLQKPFFEEDEEREAAAAAAAARVRVRRYLSLEGNRRSSSSTT